MKKIISVLLVLTILLSFGTAFAADAGDSRAVVGADLTDEQVSTVYNTFGVRRGDVAELKVTNAEERSYLDGLVDNSVIGSRSISCVYVELLPAGDGMKIEVSNITWCTKEMYINALATAGITDAKLIITAPFGVSGTAALTGVYKAYEDLTGEKISEEAKMTSTEELVITAEMADEIGAIDATKIVNELKKILAETVNMTDDEVRAEIRRIASELNVSIGDTIVNQLVKLCRSLEGLDDAELEARVEEAQKTIQNLAKAQTTLTKIGEAVTGFFKSIGDFFANLFGGKKD
ncbi:MAG: DUF1002 domain-containing protein [Oscillospiraceae bacterium]|jgi:uncharacterized protein YpuA (DUF1002 family)|nr:DUF1002 domain-containing protein [Oscillospiraceae bacterium]